MSLASGAVGADGDDVRGHWLSALLLQGCFYITEADWDARWDLDGDGVERPIDCDDADPALQARVWYVDDDGDGFGGPEAVEGCAPPDGAVDNDDDCDDDAAHRHPGAPELCNDRDDDCDGDVDEALAVVTWYADADADGFGDPAAAVESCEELPGHVQQAGDCDDADVDVHPGAVEVCGNGIDDDCDDAIDEDAPTWTVDADGDGHGDEAGAPVAACDPPPGHGPPDDCDDADDAVHPDADERCNAVDDDCNGATDDDAVDAPTWFEDCDGDGYGDPAAPQIRCTDDALPGACPLVALGGDCDDGDDGAHPAAVELCNGIDDDCDLGVDEDCVTDTGP